MTSNFHSMTSDELRAEIARGNFPPIAGADDGSVEEPVAEAPESTTEVPAVAPTVEEVYERHANPEAEAAEEVTEETPEEPAEEAVDPAEQFEQYNLALEIAADPDNEQYDTAVEILRELAPESVLERYGLTDEGMPDFEGDPDEDDPYGLGDEATGVPEIDKALSQIREFNRQREEGQTQAQAEAEAEAEETAAKAFAEDFKELSGEDLPADINSMNGEQRLLATALIGADGIEGIEDPKAFVQEVLAERDKAVEHKAVVDYIEGKREFKLPPVTERNGSTTAATPANRKEAMAGLSEVFSRHANGSDQVSG